MAPQGDDHGPHSTASFASTIYRDDEDLGRVYPTEDWEHDEQITVATSSIASDNRDRLRGRRQLRLACRRNRTVMSSACRATSWRRAARGRTTGGLSAVSRPERFMSARPGDAATSARVRQVM